MAEYQEFTEPVDPKTGEPMSEEKRKKYMEALRGRENFAARAKRDLPRASQFLRETVGDVKRRTKEVAGDIGEFGAAAAEGVGDVIKAPFEYRAALATDPEGTMAATKEFGSRVMSGDPEARRQTAEGVSMSMVEPAATLADAELARQDLAKGDYTGAAISGASVLLPFVSAGWLKTAMRKGDVPSEAAEKVAELERRVDAGEVTDDMQIRRELAMIEDAHALDYRRQQYEPLDPGEVDHPAHAEKMAVKRSRERGSELQEMAKRGESFKRVRGGKSFDGRRPESFIENYDRLTQDEIDFITHERNFVIGDPDYPEPPIPRDYNLPDEYQRPEFFVPEGMNLSNTTEDRRKLMLRPTLYTTRPIKGTDEYASYIESKRGGPGGGGVARSATDANIFAGQRQDSYSGADRKMFDYLTDEPDQRIVEEMDFVEDRFERGDLTKDEALREYRIIAEAKQFDDYVDPDAYPNLSRPQTLIDRSMKGGGRGIDDLEGPSEEEIRSMVAQDQAGALKFGDAEEYAMMMEDMRRGLAQAQQEGVDRARARTTRTPGTPAASGKVPEGSSRGERRGPPRERPKKK